jgi:hypothetical protein
LVSASFRSSNETDRSYRLSTKLVEIPMTSLLRIIPAALLALFSIPALAEDGQVCDITNLPCWGPESKCNIKIVNNTGESSGSAGGHFNQVSWAVTVKALALKPDGSRAGGNTLEILAGLEHSANIGQWVPVFVADLEHVLFKHVASRRRERPRVLHVT